MGKQALLLIAFEGAGHAALPPSNQSSAFNAVTLLPVH